MRREVILRVGMLLVRTLNATVAESADNNKNVVFILAG
jgi:hypothetical protein